MRQLARRWLCLLLCLPGYGVAASEPHERSDVIIVGAGIAGLAAALDLAQAGATVTIIDMNSQGSGHAILSTGLSLVGTPVQHSAGISDSPDQAVRDWLAYTVDGNESWLRFYAEQSRPLVYDRLVSLGVSFDNLTGDDSNGTTPRFHYPDGQGLEIVLPLYRAVLEQPNVRFQFNTEVTDILIEHGRVTGVTGNELRKGKTRSWRADHVMLATGGMAGSLERVRSNWPQHFPASAEVLAGGGVFSQGLGHDLAARAGADLAQMDRHWFYPIGIPDPLAPDSGRGISLTSPRGIWVDAHGQRFINPLASGRLILDSIMRQTPSGFWIIFDDTTRKLQRARTVRYRHDQPRYEREVLLNPLIIHRGENLALLAERSGLPAAALEATVARYNEQVATGKDDDFGRFPAVRSDNVTMPVTTPAPIQTPPFYAARIYPSNAVSMGGVQIDFGARVLTSNGGTIPGLYAAGELTGIMGMNGSRYRVNGLYLGTSILTGRSAAASILEDITSLLPAPRRSTGFRAVSTSASVASVLRTGELRSLVAQQRPGYWHFEVAHDVVLSRDLACESCHNDNFPQRAAESNEEQHAQTGSCVSCH